MNRINKWRHSGPRYLNTITRGRPHSGGSSWLDTKFTQDLRYDARGFVMRLEQHRLPYLWPSGDTTWFYTHDDAGRLTGAALDPVDWPSLPNIVDESYAYLPSNPWNLASITDNLTSTTTAFPTDDEDRIQTPDREYHAFIGALKRENGAGGQTRRYRWDVAGRLMAVLEGTDATGYAGTAYSYDPWNRLVAERPITTATATGQPVSAGSPTIHLWSGWQQVGEVESFASAPAFAWSDGPMGLAGIKREGSSHERLFSDAQGSVKYGFADDPVYTPFGKVVSGTLSTAKGFQGQEWRDEARLYYMRHRWYDPASARFLSRDPVRTGAIHNFAFAMDSPVMMGDPMGLLPAWMEAELAQAYGNGSFAEKEATLRRAVALLRQCAAPDYRKTVGNALGAVNVRAMLARPPQSGGSGRAGFTNPHTGDVTITALAFRSLPPQADGRVSSRVPVKNGTWSPAGYTPPIGSATKWDGLLIAIAHEGQHVADVLSRQGPPGPPLQTFDPRHVEIHETAHAIVESMYYAGCNCD